MTELEIERLEGQQVFVVEDDEAVRDSLSLLLESEGYVVAAFEDGQAFLDQYSDELKGCVILDIRMPVLDGMAVQKKLNELGAILPIIFVTGHGDVPLAVEAMKSGAVDFVQKPYDDEQLLNKVSEALTLNAQQVNMLQQQTTIKENLDSLTPREKEVMDMMVAGNANKVIAIDLNISQRTVEIHRSRVMHKMGTNSLAHLVKMVLSVA